MISYAEKYKFLTVCALFLCISSCAVSQNMQKNISNIETIRICALPYGFSSFYEPDINEHFVREIGITGIDFKSSYSYILDQFDRGISLAINEANMIDSIEFQGSARITIDFISLNDKIIYSVVFYERLEQKVILSDNINGKYYDLGEGCFYVELLRKHFPVFFSYPINRCE